MHVHAVHLAASILEEYAAKRAHRMPSSSVALAGFARTLRELEGILLQFIPVEKRASYLPFVPEKYR